MATMHVQHTREGKKYISYNGNKALNDIIITTHDTPAKELHNSDKRLLLPSNLFYYHSATNAAMETLDLQYPNLRVTTLWAENNEIAQSIILKIKLEIHTDINKKEPDISEHIQKIMLKGYLAANSIHKGVAINTC